MEDKVDKEGLIGTKDSKMEAEALLLTSEKFAFPFQQAHDGKRCGNVKIKLDASKVSGVGDSDDNSKLFGILHNFLLQYSDEQRTLDVRLIDNYTEYLSFELKGYLLFRLMCLLGDGLRLQLEISDTSTEIPNKWRGSKSFVSKETAFTCHANCNEAVFEGEFENEGIPSEWNRHSSLQHVQMYGTLQLKISGDLVLDNAPSAYCPILGTDECALERLENMRKMLKGQIEMDVIIVTKDGSQFPCHSSALTAHSPVLKSMLESEFKEGNTRRIEMKDMSKDVVEQFLAWVYYMNLEKASSNGTVAMELLAFAHRYSIEKLESVLKSIIMWKHLDWNDVSGAIRLFFFAKNLETFSDVQRAALTILKRNRSKLVSSQEYEKLFREEPESFKILADALILSDN